jgi:putative transcriptional regulator
MRRALRLTQEEFAARYAIPLRNIRAWERRVTVPDATARAYLQGIAGDAEGVAKALRAHQAAE